MNAHPQYMYQSQPHTPSTGTTELPIFSSLISLLILSPLYLIELKYVSLCCSGGIVTFKNCLLFLHCALRNQIL